MKRFLTVLCLLLLLSPCAAFAGEEPIIYKVKEGDTLWDISQRFIKDPYYWPNLWSHNPDIGNPHLIFPGQTLRIYDGRIEIVPVSDEGVTIIDKDVMLTPEEVRFASTFNGASSFLVKEVPKGLGTLIDTVDNRVLISEQETTVFLNFFDLPQVQPGDIYSLGSIGEEVLHPVTKQFLGYQLLELGTVTVTEVTDTVAVAKVSDSIREIERGATIFPHYTVPERIPRKISEKPLEGLVVGADEGKLSLGQWDIIHVNLGSDDGLEVGHELEMSRKRVATEHAKQFAKEITLPDIDLGDAIVVEVREQFAEALVTRTSNLPLVRGDSVRTRIK